MGTPEESLISLLAQGLCIGSEAARSGRGKNPGFRMRAHLETLLKTTQKMPAQGGIQILGKRCAHFCTGM